MPMDIAAPSQDPLLDETQAAALMSVSPRTLQAWRLRGGGPAFVRVGSRIRYCPRTLAAWLRSRSATASAPRKAKPVTLAHGSALPPRMVELIAGELARGFAGEVYIGAAATRRLSRALRAHETVLARALCRDGAIQADGTVRLVVPRNTAGAADLDLRMDRITVSYDPRTGEWASPISAGQAGFDHLCAHVWRVQGRRHGMAARDLLAFVGAAYLVHLSEGRTA